MALVEVSVVEQRYRAVLEVRAGVHVTEVAARFGVSRQSVHAWVRRYEQGVEACPPLVRSAGDPPISDEQIACLTTEPVCLK